MSALRLAGSWRKKETDRVAMSQESEILEFELCNQTGLFVAFISNYLLASAAGGSMEPLLLGFEA